MQDSYLEGKRDFLIGWGRDPEQACNLFGWLFLCQAIVDVTHFQVCRTIQKKGRCSKMGHYPAGTKNNGSKSHIFPMYSSVLPPSLPQVTPLCLSTHLHRFPTSVPTRSNNALLIKALLTSHFAHVKAFLFG